MCNFGDYLNPPIWGQKVRDQYLSEEQEVPENIGNSNVRKFADEKASGRAIQNYQMFS